MNNCVGVKYTFSCCQPLVHCLLNQLYNVLINDNHFVCQVLYLALEKRYNFSLDDLDVVANGYSHFQSYLQDEEGKNVLVIEHHL